MERPELSKKSPYWIDKHRYYELKHFCLQYPLWKKELAEYEAQNHIASAEQIIDIGRKTAKIFRFFSTLGGTVSIVMCF